jgi:hypothetical protein
MIEYLLVDEERNHLDKHVEGWETKPPQQLPFAEQLIGYRFFSHATTLSAGTYQIAERINTSGVHYIGGEFFSAEDIAHFAPAARMQAARCIGGRSLGAVLTRTAHWRPFYRGDTIGNS